MQSHQPGDEDGQVELAADCFQTIAVLFSKSWWDLLPFWFFALVPRRPFSNTSQFTGCPSIPPTAAAYVYPKIFYSLSDKFTKEKFHGVSHQKHP